MRRSTVAHSAALWLLLASPALAQQGSLPLNAASAFSWRALEASCNYTVRDGSAGQGQYVTRDCGNDESFVWLFRWGRAMPLTGTVTVYVDWKAPNTGNGVFTVALGCATVSGTTGNEDLTYAATAASGGPGTTNFQTTAFTPVVLPTTVAVDRWCGLKFLRSSFGDGIGGFDVQVRGATITW